MTSETPHFYPLSSTQREIWFDQILHPDVPLYNIGGYLRIEGSIDPVRFEQALNRLVQENDALRIILRENKNLPVQVFAEEVHITLDVHDFSDKGNPQSRAQKWMEKEFIKPFGLYNQLLFQFALLKLSGNCYYCFYRCHHLIVDGWAISLMAQRLATAYNTLITGQSTGEKCYSYLDFVKNDQAYLNSDKFTRQERYWLDKYRELPSPLIPRRYAAKFKGQTIPGQLSILHLKRELYNRLMAFAKANNASTFHVILGVLYCYFVRTGDRDELVVGLPTLNRSTKAFKQTVGLFASINPAWFRFGTDLNFVELIQAIGTELQKNYRNQRFPTSEINKKVGLHKAGRLQLFDIMLSYEKHDYDTHFNGSLAFAINFTNGFEQNALAIFIREFHGDTDVRIDFDYSLGAFEADEIERFKTRFEFLLGEILRRPSAPIKELQIMPEAEYQKILVEFNDTKKDYPRDKTIVNLFEEQVEKTPHNVAVVFQGQQLTYQELNSHANQLAHYLQTLGVKPEVLVGLGVERSIEIVIGLLGILKAGGAYVPLDPNYPTARLRFMLEDAQVHVLLTQSSLKEELSETTAQVVCLDIEAEALSQLSTDNPASGVVPENLIYVIYTSGSTGKPKGVQISHQSVTNFLNAMRHSPRLTEQDTLLAVTTLSFDIAVLELYLPLIVGAKIVLVSREVASDGTQLLERLNQSGTTVMQATPATWRLLLTAGWIGSPQLKILVGGEALSHELAHQLQQKGAQIWNLYGPTETTVWSASYQVGTTPPHAFDASEPIGHPIANTQIYILDRFMQPTPIGIAGELHIGGVGLARGYLNRPELTPEKFIPNPFLETENGQGEMNNDQISISNSQFPIAPKVFMHKNFRRDPNFQRLYKTGDLARYLPDGNIEYLGRLDNQVKIRGFRIELGEIETVLAQHSAVQENAVIVHGDTSNNPRLVAYLVPKPAQVLETSELRHFLTEKLPHYMVPQAFVSLEAMPLTPNGKIDRCTLPKPEGVRPPTTLVMPQTEVEQRIATIWQQVLQLDKVGIYDNFFDLGGHSLLLAQVHSELQTIEGTSLSAIELFQYPTIHSLAKYLTQDAQQKTSEVFKTSEVSDSSKDIAIIGLSGRFPGAKDIETFWQNLRDGVESISFFSDEQLLSEGVNPTLLDNANYVKANAILENIDLFDAAFFGYNPKEAEMMDPQHRLFLECAWEAIENAGYDVDRLPGAVGVYAGVGMNSYLLNNLFPHYDLSDSGAGYQLMITNEKDFLSTRLSYKLNLTGPSVNVQTACSTSLVAVHLACQSLQRGECQMALAGGVSIRVPEKVGYVYQEEMILSPDGHCRAFDAKAQGTISGNGAGIVVLKTVEQALADGDCIYAVIKGSAINNDGALKVGYTAPSIEGQTAVVADAMQNINYESISYIETHGTGTTLGDPIEIAALTAAYQSHTDNKVFCAIGSLKTNIGHLDAAAGVAGLIKTVLALKHKMLPPSLHFEQPNPNIDFANSPFFVNSILSEWKQEAGPRRAGVSSFGIGGTNAHLVLEEAPNPAKLKFGLQSKRPWQVLVLSAKTPSALDRATVNLADYLKQYPDINLADVAYTLSVGRKVFEHRRMLVCRTLDEATEILNTVDSTRLFTQTQEQKERPVVFMFSGQGTQYVNMTLGLYQHEPVFREQVNKCANLVKPRLNLDICQILYPPPEQTDDAVQQLEQTRLTQPALFIIEYALAKLWIAWGLRPVAMIGHSIGEYVAACLAGVFSLEEALTLVAVRGQLMQTLPAGAMLSVPLPVSEIKPLLNQELSLAAHNAPNLCVVSGTTRAVTALENQLLTQGVECLRLHTSHAFHSAMMEPILIPFTEQIKKLHLSPPQIPILSNMSGTFLTAEQATDPDYWAKHLRHTVRFAEGLQEILTKPEYALLEIGPGRTLTTIAQQHPDKVPAQMTFTSVRHPKDHEDDILFLLTTLGQLWLTGIPIDWAGFYAHEQRQRLPLPTYPFERQRYWIEGERGSVQGNKSDIADRFYLPSWKRSLLQTAERLKTSEVSSWLVFMDEYGLANSLVKQLEQTGDEIITVAIGTTYAQLNQNAYSLNPTHRQDYEALFEELTHIPKNMVHCWSVYHRSLEVQLSTELENLGFYSLLYLTQAIAEQQPAAEVRIAVISNNMQPVAGETVLYPEKATVLGPVKVIGLEYPTISCRSIDVILQKSGTWQEKRFLEQLSLELTAHDATEPVVAYRDNYRWVQTFEPIRVPRIGGVPRIDEVQQIDGINGLTSCSTVALLPNSEQRQDSDSQNGITENLLRTGGVYLITGGLGCLGLVFAEYLAKIVPQVKLILIGRSTFPQPDEWTQWLSTHGPENDISRKIAKLHKIEKLGAKVLVKAADVANESQMQAVFSVAQDRFGQLNGIIHAAGVPSGGIIQRKTLAMTNTVLAPKVRGTQILADYCYEHAVDFLVLFSSVSSLQGNFGQVDYCAANAFLDVFSHLMQRQGLPSICINWDTWQEVGMAVNAVLPPELQAWHTDNLQQGIRPNEGTAAFERILASQLPQVVVSKNDLQTTPNYIKLPLSSLYEKKAGQKHQRPALKNVYTAPSDETEKTLAALWQELLGIKPIGIHDDFFELGGHSLLATQLLSRIRDSFGVKLSLSTFFDGSTIADIAEQIVSQQLEQVENDRLEQMLADVEGLSDDELDEQLGG